jgi:hypothetical protein
MSILNAITSGAGGVALTGDTTGNLTIQSAGTNVATFSSSGLSFSANPGGGTASFLNDYEVGTWTPTITGSTSGSGSPTPSGASYIKVGKLVTIQVRYDNITFPTFVGNLYISMPFTPAQTGSGSWYGGDIYFYPGGNWGLSASFAGWIPQISVGTNYMVLGLQVVNGDRQQIATSSNTTLSNASGIYLAYSITYVSNV